MTRDKNWKNLCLTDDCCVHEAIKVIESSDSKICLIVNKNMNRYKLIGTITDGDIRRAIINGSNLSDKCSSIMNNNPTSALDNLTTVALESLLVEHQFKHVPLVSKENYLSGLYFSEIQIPDYIKNSLCIVMAGGFGKRLMPYTENIPKPMIKVRGKPMLHHIIKNASNVGFKKFALILHYLPETIMEYFGDGSKFGVEIEYVIEKTPLGTAGGIGYLDFSNKHYSAILVTNGDLISEIDYRDMINHHIKHKSFATMAVREHRLINEFGTVLTRGDSIIGFEEKPVTISNINAGIYALSQDAISLIKKGKKLNMPDLFDIALSKSHSIRAYYLYESWDDVGRINDLERLNSS